MTSGTAKQITITYVVSIDELYKRYPGQNNRQPCHLALDLEDGELACGYNPEVGPPHAVPRYVWADRSRWLDMPLLTPDLANQLLGEAAPIAQRILDGAEIRWDGNDHRGRLNDAAQDAFDELVTLIDDYRHNEPEVWDAADWYAQGDQDTDEIRDEYGIFAGSTDEQLDAVVERMCAEAAGSSDGRVLLVNVDDYVSHLRDEARDVLRHELEETAADLRRLTVHRDRMIRIIAGWGDSSRAIGALAGLSHTHVQRLTGSGQSQQETES